MNIHEAQQRRLELLEKIDERCKWELHEYQLDDDARSMRKLWHRLMKECDEYEKILEND